MNVLIVGDVGPIEREYQAGEEAMLRALLDELRGRNFDSFTVISGDPDHSRRTLQTHAIDGIGFDSRSTKNRVEREARLAVVVAAASGAPEVLDWQDPAWAVIEAVAACGAVVIAGGGKLSSVWPEYLYERCTIAAIAEIFGKRIVIASQTIGPALLERDSELLATLLKRGIVVGLREAASYSLAGQLGVESSRLRLTRDDSMFLAGEDSEIPLNEPFCVVTISPECGLASPQLYATQLAAYLDVVATRTGLTIVFLPHRGKSLPHAASEDSLIHAQVADLMISSNVKLLPVLTARKVAAITRNAALCISTRYHSVVFAASGGVPSIGISVDEYTAVEIGGAQANVGMSEWAIPLVSLPAGRAEMIISETWERRAEIRKHLLATAASAKKNASAWWDEVAAALRGVDFLAPESVSVNSLMLRDRQTASVNTRLNDWSSSESALFLGARLSWAAEQQSIDQLRLEIAEAENAVGQTHADLLSAQQRVREADAAASAAHELMSVIAEPLFERTLSAHDSLGAAAALDALLSTRTFRWTQRARLIYSSMRRNRERKSQGVVR